MKLIHKRTVDREKIASNHSTVRQNRQKNFPLADDLVEIGKLGRAHGIFGDIILNYYAESVEWLKYPLWLGSAHNSGLDLIPARVLFWREYHGHILLRLAELNDRTGAEQVRGKHLYIEKKLLPASDEKNIYLRDLCGLKIILHESGEYLGILSRIDSSAGQEIWVIKHAESDRKNKKEESNADKKEILFPAEPEFVDDIDLDKGEIRISPPPGLLEIYL